ncbi:60S ribosomal protein L37, partial [Ophiophagus hannah]
MTEGTSSFGKCRNKTHTLCRQCGSKAYHLQKSTCGKCGYPAKRKRKVIEENTTFYQIGNLNLNVVAMDGRGGRMDGDATEGMETVCLPWQLDILEVFLSLIVNVAFIESEIRQGPEARGANLLLQYLLAVKYGAFRKIYAFGIKPWIQK